MVLSYHYPLRILLGIIIAAAVAAVAYYLKKRNKKGKPLRVANSARLKSHPLYKKALMQSRVFRILSTAGIILSLTAALFLSARPYRRSAFKENVNRRDIFLCIDLSPSNYRGVKDLVNEFSHVVEGLDGDRIGISVFNTSSVRYVPMTDDYDFALERLEALAGYLAAEEEFTTKYVDRYDSVYDIPASERDRYTELNNILSTFDKGTTAGYEVKGTSAVGEGLASCLFSFPELSKEERTRAIILVTDNHEELFDDPLVTLEESAQMCAQNKVTVFGIYPGDSQASAGSAADGQSGSGVDGEAPSSPGQTGGSGQGSNDGSPGSGSYSASDSASDRNRMKESVELTGGKFYDAGSSLTAKEILEDIRSQEIINTDTATASVDTDMPFFWFCVLIIGFVLIVATTLYFVLRRGIRRGLLSRKLTAAILLVLMTAGIVVIGIRPMYLSPSAELMTDNLDVAFVVDTTISMWAEDHGGETRIDGVKRDIYRIMNSLPGSSFSVIRFADGAEILSPFTQDIDSIYDILNNLNMPGYSTAQGSSLNTAYDALQTMLTNAGTRGRDRRTIVFVFSDGETTDGSELMSFSSLGGMIHEGAVLGYGTEKGGKMYYPGRGYVKNVSTGEAARSVIDEDALRQIASDLGIQYINETESLNSSGQLNFALSSKLQSIRMLSTRASFQAGNRTGYNETYHYFSAATALLLIIWISLTVYRGNVA